MPSVQTEWVDVEQQTKALLHKSSRAATRTITSRISREAGESIARRAPAGTKVEQFLRDLKDRNSLRPALTVEEAHFDAAFQRMDRDCTGVLRTDDVSAWVLAAGVQAGRLRAWHADCFGEYQAQHAQGMNHAQFMDCCRCCGVNAAALLRCLDGHGESGSAGAAFAWGSLRARATTAEAFQPDLAPHPLSRQQPRPVAASMRMDAVDALPASVRAERRRERGPVGPRASGKAGGKRADGDTTEPTNASEPAATDPAAGAVTAGTPTGPKKQQPTHERLFTSHLQKEIVAHRSMALSTAGPSAARASTSAPSGATENSALQAMAMMPSSDDAELTAKQTAVKQLKKKRQVQRARINASLQAATNLSGSVGMISRHLQMEALKQQREERHSDTRYGVDRRKIQNRLVRTRYAVYHDRKRANRDAQIREGQDELEMMLDQTRMETQLEEDLVRQYKQVITANPTTRLINESIPVSELQELHGRKRREVLAAQARMQLMTRDAQIAEFTRQRQVARTPYLLHTPQHLVDGEQLETPDLDEGFRTMLSSQQRGALSGKVHPDSPFGVAYAASHPRPQPLQNAPGQVIIPPPSSSIVAQRHFSKSGVAPPSPSAPFGMSQPRHYAARCDADASAFHVLDFKTVNKRFLET
jgi:hypothetical protein